MSQRPILVTGFDRFGTHEHNSSEAIALGLAAAGDPRFTCRVLPTSYRRASELIETWITQEQPRAVVMLGLAASAEALRLERFARNRDHSESADNDGESRPDRSIFRAAPEAYASTLPLERFAVALRRKGTPVELSESAGGFLCNHVFFRARHALELDDRQTPCGFLHVPATRPGQLEPWLGAVSECLEVLVESLESG
jgi:pyroglutamyl-peptidase